MICNVSHERLRLSQKPAMLADMSYPGGKGNIFQHIVNVLPKHHTYIETHLGSGAVMRKKKAAERSIGIDADPEVISDWRRKFPSQCELICTDAVQFLRSFSFKGDEVVYSDPPYWPTTRRQQRIYRYEYSESQHIELLRELRQLNCRVVLSGYQNDAYERALSGWKSLTFLAPTQCGLREETLWLNYDLPEELHDFSFIGSNFREREAIRRRLGTLRRKIEQLRPLERASLITWLLEQYPITPLPDESSEAYA